jgi:hypothetical protein
LSPQTLPLKIIVFALIIITSQTNFAQNCGVERWDVKTLSDRDTSQIDFTAIIKSSVHEQIAIGHPPGKLKSRVGSERTAYSITCYIIGYKKEKDKDIHIIVKDSFTNDTMVIEITSPVCPAVQATSRYKQFKEVYAWFESNIGEPHGSFTYLPQPKLVCITGIGFWDHVHGQKGMAANGREIHPVLSVRFGL